MRNCYFEGVFGPVKAVVFDFDGTLVDSMGSVIKGLGEAITFATGRTISSDELVASFGPPPFGILTQWVPQEKVAAAYDHWLNFERALGPADFRAYEGSQDLLETLATKKIPIGIFTGRDRAGTIHILKHQGWFKKFFTEATIVCGDDGFPAKPKPDCLLHLMQSMKLDPATTLMVGDHAYDMMAGRAAGTKTAAALWSLPPKGSQKIAYREAWQKWDSVDCDMRLEKPSSLMRWIETA